MLIDQPVIILFHQADAIYDMIGFPEFILDPKELDDVYDGVSDSFVSVSSLVPCLYVQYSAVSVSSAGSVLFYSILFCSFSGPVRRIR